MSAKSQPISLELRHVTRDDDTDWEAIEADHIQIWGEACSLLNTRTYSHNGCKAKVAVDWQPLVARLSHLHGLRAEAYSRTPPKAFDWSPFWEPLALDGEVELEGKNELSEYTWYPSFFAELYAYDVFTILNLSYPGSCNFLNLTIRANGGKTINEPRLAGYSLDFALVDTRAGKWPIVRVLPLGQVANWHSSLALGVKQVAETSVEKLLFAMLHLVKTDDYVEAVIWVFYALEALVETRVGESISTLVRRISLLLDLSDQQRSTLNKKIRTLYDLRSSVVHGGYRVRHPIAQEVVEKRIGDETGQHLELFQFGFTIVVACLQALIARGWTTITYEERMAGGGGEL
jgi:hypothetical protein